MEHTLQQLGEILLSSIPTIIIFLLLHFYLKAVLYRPLARVLGERSSRTEGKFEAARQAVSEAGGKLAAYEEAIRAARLSAYRLIEQRRKQAMEERAALLARARTESEQALQAAREQISADILEAKHRLREEADSIAGEIVAAVLRGVNVSRPTAPA